MTNHHTQTNEVTNAVPVSARASWMNMSLWSASAISTYPFWMNVSHTWQNFPMEIIKVSSNLIELVQVLTNCPRLRGNSESTQNRQKYIQIRNLNIPYKALLQWYWRCGDSMPAITTLLLFIYLVLTRLKIKICNLLHIVLLRFHICFRWSCVCSEATFLFIFCCLIL